MSSGYLAAATTDLVVAREMGVAFGLDVVEVALVGDHETLAATLAAAPNIGIVLSTAAAQDSAFVSLLQSLAARLATAQIIVIDADARAAFAFLPDTWPIMSLDEARRRAAEAARRRQEASGAPALEPEPTPDPAPKQADSPEPEAPIADAEAEVLGGEDAQFQEQQQQQQQESEQAAAENGDEATPAAPEPESAEELRADDETPGEAEGETQSESFNEDLEAPPSEPLAPPQPDAPSPEADLESFGAGASAPEPEADEAPPPAAEILKKEAAPPPADHAQSEADAPTPIAPAPASISPQAPPHVSAPPAEPPAPPRRTVEDRFESGARTMTTHSMESSRGRDIAPSAQADATAFAPKKLRRGTPELVRIAIHQPKDLKAVIKAAKKADARTDAAPQSMGIGEIAFGASIGVALDVKGAAADGAMQRQTWTGAPLAFSFSVEADADVKQAVFMVRVFIDDAQIGVLAFTRPVSGPAKKAASDGERVRLKRHKRVFLSYSSKDRETVAAIATAYQMAGVPHFFDRTSLKSGEQWHPRLRREIDRSDLFHLCWSKAAAESEWVEKEAEHALTRQRRSNGKNPAITVQMLDGPPWAAHPAKLDSINFDDFVRAAIVGYARGEG